MRGYVFVGAGDAPDRVDEGLCDAGARGVDPRDGAEDLGPFVLGGERAEDGHHWRGTDATRDQHGGHALLGRVAGIDEKVALGVGQLDLVPLGKLVVEDVGDDTGQVGGVRGWLFLDADAVVLALFLGSFAQAVLPALEVAVRGNMNLQADVLPREVLGQPGAVRRAEVEAGDDLAFLHLPQDPELSPAKPVVSGIGLVERALAVDKDGGESTVRIRPRVDDGRGGGSAENSADGLYQVLADNIVLIGGDTKRDVFVSDALNRGRELGQIVDIGSVAEHGTGQGTRLATCDVAGLVEYVAELWVLAKHGVVEDFGDLETLLLENRRCGLDYVDLGLCEGSHGGGQEAKQVTVFSIVQARGNLMF